MKSKQTVMKVEPDLELFKLTLANTFYPDILIRETSVADRLMEAQTYSLFWFKEWKTKHSH